MFSYFCRSFFIGNVHSFCLYVWIYFPIFPWYSQVSRSNDCLFIIWICFELLLFTVVYCQVCYFNSQMTFLHKLQTFSRTVYSKDIYHDWNDFLEHSNLVQMNGADCLNCQCKCLRYIQFSNIQHGNGLNIYVFSWPLLKQYFPTRARQQQGVDNVGHCVDRINASMKFCYALTTTYLE